MIHVSSLLPRSQELVTKISERRLTLQKIMKRRYYYNEESQIERAIIQAIASGHPKVKAAKMAGIHRATLFRWLERKQEFAKDFAEAWNQGAKARDYRVWLNHPFRGKRPPTSKRTRSFPRHGRPRITR